MRRYDYTFIEDLGIPASTFSSMHRVLSLNDNLEDMISGNTELFSKLMNIASVESVKGSNAIEGIGSTDERVRGIVLHDTAPIGHDEEAIAGYRDALDMIHNEWRDRPFDEDTICELHRVMYRYIGEGGNFKKVNNVIVDRTEYGEVVRWTPVSAEDTEDNVKAMVRAYSDVYHDKSIEPMILIPCVILDFLCIHPFSDGNGRMSRLLTGLLMYHHALSIQRYVSMESVINATKDRYYDALAASSKGWHEGNNDYVPFIRYFIDTLGICVKELDRRRISLSGRKVNKTQRIEATVLGSLVPISKAEICDMLLDVSPNTVESVLHRMLKEGRIVKVGTTRSARYRRA